MPSPSTSHRLHIPAEASKEPVARIDSPLVLGFHATALIDLLWPPVIVLRRLKLVREYTLTVLSEEAEAAIGNVGCGTVCQARVDEAGVSVARGEIVRGSAEVTGSGMVNTSAQEAPML